MISMRNLATLFCTVMFTVSSAPVQSKEKLTAQSSPVAIAQQYVGLNTREDRTELRSVVKVDPRRVPWCAAFVNAVLEMAGYEGTGSLLARSFLDLGRRVQEPRRGDIVVLKRGSEEWSGHVGFYVGETVVKGVRYVEVLGGNQRDSVAVSLYPKRLVLGYRRMVDESRRVLLASVLE
jgi:uncharacterized protein (TIGR02594 family)